MVIGMPNLLAECITPSLLPMVSYTWGARKKQLHFGAQEERLI